MLVLGVAYPCLLLWLWVDWGTGKRRVNVRLGVWIDDALHSGRTTKGQEEGRGDDKTSIFTVVSEMWWLK